MALEVKQDCFRRGKAKYAAASRQKKKKRKCLFVSNDATTFLILRLVNSRAFKLSLFSRCFPLVFRVEKDQLLFWRFSFLLLLFILSFFFLYACLCLSSSSRNHLSRFLFFFFCSPCGKCLTSCRFLFSLPWRLLSPWSTCRGGEGAVYTIRESASFKSRQMNTMGSEREY